MVPSSFEEAAPRLTAKVYPRASLPDDAAGELVIRPITDELLAAILLEEESSFVSLSRKASVSWGKPEEELWATALANVHQSVPLSENRVPLEPRGVVRFLHNEHRLAVSHVLELESHLVEQSPHGVVVGMPHENLFVLYEIVEGSASTGAGYVARVSADYFVRSPNTGITPIAYWWRDGNWEPITKRVGDHFEDAPPAGFLTMLEALEPAVSHAHD